MLGYVCFKTESLSMSVNSSYSLLQKSSIHNDPVKGFFSQLLSLLFGGKYSRNKFFFKCLSFSVLYPILQDISCSFTAATLSSSVNTIMLQPCTNRLNMFTLLKLSVKYVSCCNQRTDEKQLADGVSVLDKKKLVISFSVVTLSSELYRETANKLQYEKSKFHTHCHCHCRAL